MKLVALSYSLNMFWSMVLCTALSVILIAILVLGVVYLVKFIKSM